MEASLGEYPAVLRRKGLTQALSGRGGAADGAGGQGNCGHARALLTQRRFPRSPVEGSRLAPSAWCVVRFEGRRHLRAFRGSRPLEAVVRSQPPEALGRKASRSWGGAGQGGDLRRAPPWRPPLRATPFLSQVPRLLAEVARAALLTGY